MTNPRIIRALNPVIDPIIIPETNINFEENKSNSGRIEDLRPKYMNKE